MTTKRTRRPFKSYCTTVDVDIDEDDIVEYLIDEGYTVIPPGEEEFIPQCSDDLQDLVRQMYWTSAVKKEPVTEEQLSKLFYDVLGRIT